MKIAIDGPAASGKSTVARELSLRLKVPYLETGLAYRAVGYLLLAEEGRVPVHLEWDRLKLLLPRIQIEPSIGKTFIYIGSMEVSSFLETEEVGKVASLVGTMREFREHINRIFRRLISGKQCVVEGRDAGTNIVPEADLKVFITASPEERARRRYTQLRKSGKRVSYEKVLKDILERDRRDSMRKDYPLKIPKDAVVIDTTNKTLEEIIEELMTLIRERGYENRS